MIKVKNHNQQTLFDPWPHFGPKRGKLLEESWAGFFQTEILSILSVKKFSTLFVEDFGRPTKELTTCLGIVEATMSEYDRKAEVMHLRVRGFSKVRFAAILKAVRIDIFRDSSVRQAKKRKTSELFVYKLIFSAINQQFWAFNDIIAEILLDLSKTQSLFIFIKINQFRLFT